MKHVVFLIAIACAGSAANAQSRVWRETTSGEHYEIVRVSAFAGVEVQDQNGRPTVQKLFSEGKDGGFVIGDIITAVENIGVSNAREWEAAIEKFKPEQKVTVRVLRQGRPVELPVRLGKVNVFGKVV
ncbi:PDZ domain-containing protein [Flaviaesturariibacter flavus]|uniref:PDZ domain-containing protein n=1 Tax=Flaviaesturariibacter flavus TaxID=2502780 RepID=A0A4R1BQM9_9BACT|nr:PDZ domain-containing protein [Flaviaesturariibacter flavus]TCJ19597.1 PDZ domain-containing protein [Flaviaesturariibacter flavus]